MEWGQGVLRHQATFTTFTDVPCFIVERYTAGSSFLYRNLRINIWFIVDPAWLLGARNSSQTVMLNSRVWLMLIFFAFRVMEIYGTMR